MQENARPVVAVDPARPGAERTGVRVVSPQQKAVEQRWNADPVRFAQDLGVTLSRKERQVLRDAMQGRSSGKHAKKVLETVRRKLEAGIRRANEMHSAAGRPMELPAEMIPVAEQPAEEQP